MARPVSAKKVREILGSKKTLIIRKKQSSLDKTANLLADIIGEHLDALPLDERKRRSANAHKFIQARKESYEKVLLVPSLHSANVPIRSWLQPALVKIAKKSRNILVF